MQTRFSIIVLAVILAGAGLFGLWQATGSKAASPASELLNVSYDVSRELWRDLNAAFIPPYEREAGVRLEINQSHGGTGSQARAVVDGLDADVVESPVGRNGS